MFYVVTIKKLSNDSIDRAITPYDDKATALRKYHEAFNVIGGGPKRITAMIIEDSVSNNYGSSFNENGEPIIEKYFNVGVIMQETWISDDELAAL